ncbi:MAG: hypothetical protein KKF50_00725 [Nanoarchaeota archaeon]|nr:hypothetical protein [Nanoarchaeota archaeon]
MDKEENKIWRFIKDLVSLLLNKIPGVKDYRETLRNRKVDKNFQYLKEELDRSKEFNKETALLKQILDKKILDKRRLLETIRGKYFLLIVFAFPKLPELKFNEDKETIANFLAKRLKKKGHSNKRFYTLFLTEKLKFSKLGYPSSTSFFKKIEDLPRELRKINSLKKHLEENLLIQQKKEWDFAIKILNESKNKKIMKYVERIEEKGFAELYNISFYLDFINFGKDNIFAQDENSSFISNFLKLENIVENKKSLESLRENFRFFDISLFFTRSIPKDIKENLGEEQNKIKSFLRIEHFFQEINKQDLKQVFKEILNKKYEESYADIFCKRQSEFRDFLIKKGVIV